MIGSATIFLILLGIEFAQPSIGVVQALLITGLDIFLLLWQRAMTLRGRPKLATWINLVAAAIIGTIGLHLGGGFITLSLGVYLILILTAALVFQTRAAAYTMAITSASLYILLVIAELTNFLPPNNSSFLTVYDFNEQSRILVANVLMGLLLIFLTMLAAGGAAEILGKWASTLTEEVESKTAQLIELFDNMELTYNSIVSTLANAIEVRDYYTSDHSNRIATLAVETAKLLGYDKKGLERVRLAAMLHDIGKIGIPDHILNKPGPLTEKERIIIMKHPEIGAKIVSTVNEFSDIAYIIRAHQEKFDGTGYPDGLLGDEIPLSARIISAIDAYIAITDERPYKPARSELDAQKELIANAGTQFDPQVVEAFLYVLQLRK